jgi:hypothetical protein
MIPTILINLFIGYTIPFIDNAAHMGGFVAGALLALFVGYKRPGQRASVAVLWHVLQIASLVLVVISFGQVARHMGGLRPQFDNAAQAQTGADAVSSYVEAVNEGQVAFRAAFNEGDAEAAKRAIARLEGAAPLDQQPDQIRLELKQLLARARDLALLSADERNGEGARGQLKQLASDFAAWEKRSDEWVKNEGGNYGIVLQPDDEAAPPAAATATPATPK